MIKKSIVKRNIRKKKVKIRNKKINIRNKKRNLKYKLFIKILLKKFLISLKPKNYYILFAYLDKCQKKQIYSKNYIIRQKYYINSLFFLKKIYKIKNFFFRYYKIYESYIINRSNLYFNLDFLIKKSIDKRNIRKEKINCFVEYFNDHFIYQSKWDKNQIYISKYKYNRDNRI